MKKLTYLLALACALTAFSSTYAQDRYRERRDDGGRRSWSPEARDAVIGAGAGAIVGAVVSRHPGKGALIGGLIGGGAGYLYGRSRTRVYYTDYNYPVYTSYRRYNYRPHYEHRYYRPYFRHDHGHHYGWERGHHGRGCGRW